MMAVVAWLVGPSVIVFAVTSMLAVGLGQTVQEVIAPLRNLSAVVRALLANFVLVPILAFTVLKVLPVTEPHAVGFS